MSEAKTLEELKNEYPEVAKQLEEKFTNDKALLEKEITEKLNTVLEDINKLTEGNKALNEEVVKCKVEIEQLKSKNNRLAIELDTKTKAEIQFKANAEHRRIVNEEVDKVLQKPEFKLYQTLIRKELTDELIEKTVDVEPMLLEIKDKISKTIVEMKRQEIISSGLGEKGILPSEDTLPLTEQVVRFNEACMSGYKGSFDQYRKNILKLS